MSSYAKFKAERQQRERAHTCSLLALFGGNKSLWAKLMSCSVLVVRLQFNSNPAGFQLFCFSARPKRVQIERPPNCNAEETHTLELELHRISPWANWNKRANNRASASNKIPCRALVLCARAPFQFQSRPVGKSGRPANRIMQIQLKPAVARH